MTLTQFLIFLCISLKFLIHLALVSYIHNDNDHLMKKLISRLTCNANLVILSFFFFDVRVRASNLLLLVFFRLFMNLSNSSRQYLSIDKKNIKTENIYAKKQIGNRFGIASEWILMRGTDTDSN